MTTLRLLTGFKQDDDPELCTEDYVCECTPCRLERLALVARGIRPDLPQPWQAKRAA
jgi:hypothetical protein